MNEWIDIRHRLPEEDEIVIVWLGDGWNIAVYRKILNWKMKKELKFCSVHKRILSFEGVTHWKPAPRSPLVERYEKIEKNIKPKDGWAHDGMQIEGE